MDENFFNSSNMYNKKERNSPVMEVSPLEKQNVVPNQLYSLMAELVLDHAVREYEIRRLYEEIDLSLARRDKKRFMKLTEELKMILEDK